MGRDYIEWLRHLPCNGGRSRRSWVGVYSTEDSFETYERWQQDAEEARKEAKRKAGQTATENEILDLMMNEPGRWFTCQDAVEGLGLKWQGRGNDKDAKRVRNAMNSLTDEGEIERKKEGNLNVYRFESEDESDSPGTQNESAASATSAPLQDKGFECRDQASATSARSEQGSGAETAEASPLHRNPMQRSAAEVAEAAEAESTPSLLDASHSSRSSSLIGSGAEVMDDDDDPAWGPRPTAQEET